MHSIASHSRLPRFFMERFRQFSVSGVPSLYFWDLNASVISECHPNKMGVNYGYFYLSEEHFLNTLYEGRLSALIDKFMYLVPTHLTPQESKVIIDFIIFSVIRATPHGVLYYMRNHHAAFPLPLNLSLTFKYFLCDIDPYETGLEFVQSEVGWCRISGTKKGENQVFAIPICPYRVLLILPEGVEYNPSVNFVPKVNTSMYYDCRALHGRFLIASHKAELYKIFANHHEKLRRCGVRMRKVDYVLNDCTLPFHIVDRLYEDSVKLGLDRILVLPFDAVSRYGYLKL